MIFEVHLNSYFVKIYYINILTKHILTTKNRSSFLKNWGERCGMKM